MDHQREAARRGFLIIQSELQFAYEARNDLHENDVKTWQARFESRLTLALRLLRRAGLMELSPLMARLIAVWNEWYSARQQDLQAPFPWLNVSLTRDPLPNTRIQENFRPMKLDDRHSWWKNLRECSDK